MQKHWLIVIIIIFAAVALGLLLMPKETQAPETSFPGGEKDTQSVIDITGKQAVLKTTLGDITLQFYPEDAPKAVENFLGLAQKGYYNGVIFHRVVADFVIQAGDPTATGRGGESLWGGVFEDELNPESESYKTGYKKGVLAMANRGPNTNTSQFFITLRDAPLDHLYTIFGRVVEGLDVVERIGKVQVDATDKPVEDIVINSIEIKNK